MNYTNDDIVVVTGGFDPIHSGHIDYINSARNIGRVIVGLNSDQWLERKKGACFMPFDERFEILSNLKNVMSVIPFDDSDDTACDAIHQVKNLFPRNKVIFANGGDRTLASTPELDVFKNDPQVNFVMGVGGSDKKNSSSWLLDNWIHPTESRVWGISTTYHSSNNLKIKRIVLDPGAAISMQYHNQRSEFWMIEDGIGVVYTSRDGVNVEQNVINKHDHFFVKQRLWHQLKNEGNTPLSVVEIQYGTECTELDIIRK